MNARTCRLFSLMVLSHKQIKIPCSTFEKTNKPKVKCQKKSHTLGTIPNLATGIFFLLALLFTEGIVPMKPQVEWISSKHVNFTLKQNTKSTSVPLSRGSQVAEISEKKHLQTKKLNLTFPDTQKSVRLCFILLCEVTFKLFVSSVMSSHIISQCRLWCNASLEPRWCLKCCIYIGRHQMYCFIRIHL